MIYCAILVNKNITVYIRYVNINLSMPFINLVKDIILCIAGQTQQSGHCFHILFLYFLSILYARECYNDDPLFCAPYNEE